MVKDIMGMKVCQTGSAVSQNGRTAANRHFLRQYPAFHWPGWTP